MFVDLKKINPKKILVINTFGIGDVLFTIPFIGNLKHHFPNCEISYLTNRRVASLLEEDKKISCVFIYERDYFVGLYKKSKSQFWREAKALFDEIKKENFDVVFDFSLNTSIGFFTWLAGIKYRIGYNYKNRGRFLTHSLPLVGFEGKHVVEFYLDLLPFLGLDIVHHKMDIALSSKDEEWARKFCKDNGINLQKPLVAILPGAGASWGKNAKYRRWDTRNYAELMDKMIEKKGVQIILVGDLSDEKLGEEVKSQSRNSFVGVFGKTTGTQLAALLKCCYMAILNDGGPLHVAVAVGIKTVSIFGPVDEHVYGPYNPGKNHLVVNSAIPCRPCYRRFRMTNCEHISCLKLITVDQVFATIERLL